MKILILLLLAPFSLLAQLNADFTYSLDTSGLVHFINISTYNPTSTNDYGWDFGDNSFLYNIDSTFHTFKYNSTYKVCLTIWELSPGNNTDTICKTVAINNTQSPPCPPAPTYTLVNLGAGTGMFELNNFGLSSLVEFGDGNMQSFQGLGTNSYSHQYNLIDSTYTVKIKSYYWDDTTYVNHLCSADSSTLLVTAIPCKAQPAFWNVTANSFDVIGIQISGGIGTPNYNWTLDNLPYGNYFNYPTWISSPILPAGMHTVCLTVNGEGGCYNSKCDSILLNPNNLCGNTISGGAVVGQCNTFELSFDSTTTLNNFNWKLNDSTISTSYGATFIYNFGGTNSNIMNNILSWSATGSGCSESGSIVLYNPAGYSIELDTAGSINTWYLSPFYDETPDFETWDFGDGTTSILQYPSHTYAASGNYNICHTVSINGCVNSYCYTGSFYRTNQLANISQVQVLPAFNPTSFSEVIKKDLSLSLFPNPTNKVLSIKCNSLDKNSSFRIMNTNGEILKKGNLISTKNETSLNVTDLENGIYFISILTTDGYKTSKFIKN